MDKKNFPHWIWPLGLAVAGLGTAATVLTRGCWHTHLSWPIAFDDEFSYQVCTQCGAKRLFDEKAFMPYGPYGYDVHELIARERAYRIRRLQELKERKEKIQARAKAREERRSAEQSKPEPTAKEPTV